MGRVPSHLFAEIYIDSESAFKADDVTTIPRKFKLTETVTNRDFLNLGQTGRHHDALSILTGASRLWHSSVE